ncbi:MAG: PA14 domain-containing protein [Pseudomonadota bacterium]
MLFALLFLGLAPLAVAVVGGEGDDPDTEAEKDFGPDADEYADQTDDTDIPDILESLEASGWMPGPRGEPDYGDSTADDAAMAFPEDSDGADTDAGHSIDGTLGPSDPRSEAADTPGDGSMAGAAEEGAAFPVFEFDDLADGEDNSDGDEPATPDEGFRARYFAVDPVSSLDQIDWSQAPVHEEMVDEVQYDAGRGAFYEGGATDHFAAEFSGQLNVAAEGDYTFWLRSDDGGKLTVGDAILGNDGVHAARTESFTLHLEPGAHDVPVQYFEHCGHAVVELDWAGPDTGGARVALSGEHVTQPPAENPPGHGSETAPEVPPAPAYETAEADKWRRFGTKDADMLDTTRFETSEDGNVDVIRGRGGDDVILGGQGTDVLRGGGGNDVIDHNGGGGGWNVDGDRDVLRGGRGDDRLFLDREDTATGGLGQDAFTVFHDSSDAASRSAAFIRDFVPGEDTLRIELDADTALNPDDVSVKLTAQGTDSEVFVGGEMVATLRGVTDISPDSIDVTIAEETEADPPPVAGSGDAGYDGSRTRVIAGTHQSDEINAGQHDDGTGAAINDRLWGRGGDDILRGGRGADRLSGGAGDDFIDHMGHNGEDSGQEWRQFDWNIDGDADTLYGGAGNDVLKMDRYDSATGGQGQDTFWVSHDSSDDGAARAAHIQDFVPGDDFLRIELDPGTDLSAVNIAVETSEDGRDSIVLVDGELVATLTNAAGATVADVMVTVAEDVFPSGPTHPPTT